MAGNHGILRVDTVRVVSDIGECQIQLCVGDIIKLPLEDKIDVLVISAFPDDYVPTPPSLIGQLLHCLNIDVGALAKDKEEDLRNLYSCWWSKPLSDDLSFRKILCFEGGYKVGKKSPQMAGDIFRCLVPALGTKEASVMMPLLASGAQKFSKKLMLEQLVKVAIHWIMAGLPLRCMKIVLLETDPANTGLILHFKTMKNSYLAESTEKHKEYSSEYDIYLSYCEEDKQRTQFIIECLTKKNKNITVFSTLQELNMEESWQEQLYDTITSCKRVMALITPAYLKSTSCSEQYNIALCHSRKLHHNFLIPLYLSDVSYMPTYMGITQYIDCRVHDEEKIAEACTTVVGSLVSFDQTADHDLFVNRLSLLEPHYDVFLSYSHFNEDVAEKVIKKLRIYRPDIKIFLDTAELKAGGVGQQALYEAIDRSQAMIALISGHYLRSKVCIEEISLGIALQRVGNAKLWPVVIEPLSDSVPWLQLISPVECLEGPQQQESSNLSALCKNILKDISEPSSRSIKEEVTTTLEDVRKNIPTQTYFISSVTAGMMLLQECESKGPPSSQENSRKLIPNHVDIYVISAKEDVNYCRLFCQLLISQNQSLIIKKSFEESNSSRMAYLETTSLVIPLLSPNFLSSTELVHELNIAWCRQRYDEEFCFLAIITDALPVKPTYVHLLPCFFNCKDKRWQQSLEKEIPSSLEDLAINVPQEVTRCFMFAVTWTLSWINGEDCSVWGLHDMFSNCVHLSDCLTKFAKTVGPNKTTDGEDVSSKTKEVGVIVETTTDSSHN